jgi:membrane protease YdiL (CAAX protease family)
MAKGTRFIDFDFDKIRRTNWAVIALVVLVDAALLAVAMLVILPFLQSSFPLEQVTGGLVQATLVFSILRLVVALGIAMLTGHLRARDVGLEWGKLLSGALVVFGLWIVMQVIVVLAGVVASGQVALSPIWTPERIPLIAGDLIAQFLGNAPAEEVIYRGFLLTQVYLLLKGPISGRKWRVTAAVLASQLLFSLSHIPQRLVTGSSPLALLPDLLLVWLVGILLAVLYLRTENLFVVIGVHALNNAPVTIAAPPSQAIAGLLPLVLTIVLILIWRPLMHLIERQRDAPSSRERPTLRMREEHSHD